MCLLSAMLFNEFRSLETLRHRHHYGRDNQVRKHRMLSEIDSGQLRENGFVMLSKWRPRESTSAIAWSIGKVVNLQALLSFNDPSLVQVLRPRHKSQSTSNRYSGVFGFDEYPFHTDFAHWARPPRYVLLRCRIGFQGVTTNLLSTSKLECALGSRILRNALVRPRRSYYNGNSCLLPVKFDAKNTHGYRWDSLFLVAINDAACQVREFMSSRKQKSENLATLALCYPGDTLIFDNWNLFHGRSRVPEYCGDRRLERVYFSEMYI